MKKERIVKILFSICIVIIFLYLRTHSSLYANFANVKVIKTVLSLLIVLVTVRTIIEIIIVSANIDNRSNRSLVKDNLLIGMKNLYTIVAVISVFLGILSLMGLELREVFTTLSIVAAAIAIVTKEFLAELIIGIINGFSSKIEIEDIVEYNGQKGKIVEIGLQKITLMTDDDDILYVPNTKFYNSDIVNYTKRDIRRMSIDFQIDTKKVGSIEDLENQIILACTPMDNHLVPNSFNLKVIKVTKDAIDFKFQYTLKEVRREIQRQMRRIILRTVTNIVTRQVDHG
jgi:small-conductance mechanosensitive channel